MLTIVNSIISNNRADEHGGGICNANAYQVSVNIYNSEISSNWCSE